MLLSLLMSVGAAAPQATPDQDVALGVRAALEHARRPCTWVEERLLVLRGLEVQPSEVPAFLERLGQLEREELRAVRAIGSPR